MGPIMLTVFWKPRITWFGPGCQPAKTYPGLANACKMTAEFSGK
jgi:hypothetical protein